MDSIVAGNPISQIQINFIIKIQIIQRKTLIQIHDLNLKIKIKATKLINLIQTLIKMIIIIVKKINSILL